MLGMPLPSQPRMELELTDLPDENTDLGTFIFHNSPDFLELTIVVV